jgi:RHS repeat-associated protein
MTQSAVCTSQVCCSRSRYTGKERDTKSGNDYFGARYYASSMGRYMSLDPSGLLYADPTNPQSLNLYAYALNNPLKLVDPTGLTACFYGGHGDTPIINGKGNDKIQLITKACQIWLRAKQTEVSLLTLMHR